MYYCGTSEDWQNLLAGIGSNNTPLTNAQIYFYSEDEPDFEDGKSYWYWDEEGGIVVWTKEDGD